MTAAPLADVLYMGSTTTLTPHIHAYLVRRQRLHTYAPKSAREVRYRLASLDRSFGRRPLDRLTRRAIERWMEGLDRLAPSSRRSYLASARQFTAWLTAEGHVDVDPCLDVPMPRPVEGMPRALSPADVAATLDACRTDRERAIVWLMVGLGLRRMEVAALRWDHYDARDRTLWVAPSKGGGGERVLPVVDGCAAALDAIRGHAGGPVVRSEADDGPLAAPRIGQLVTRAMTAAGVKRAAYDGRSAHALRHTAASDVLDESGDLRAVQEMLGHRRLTTTAVYLRRRGSLPRLRTAMEGRTYQAEEAA